MNQHASEPQRLTRDAAIAIALLILLLAVPLGYFIYSVLRPPQVTVTALFEVASAPQDLNNSTPHIDEHEADVFRRTQRAYFKSYFVLQAALRGPGVESLSILAPHQDKVAWL